MTSTAIHLDQPELPLDAEYISRQDTGEDPRRRVTEDPQGPGRPAPEPGRPGSEPGRPTPTEPNAPSRRKGEPGPGGGEEEAGDEEARFVGVGTA